MYSVNGQCVAQSTTEEIKTILTNRYNWQLFFGYMVSFLHVQFAGTKFGLMCY